jgi:hypothetical protein
VRRLTGLKKRLCNRIGSGILLIGRNDGERDKKDQ